MSNIDRAYCCNLSVLEDTTKEGDNKISSAKTDVKKKRNWGWRKKRPDTPMINKISTIEWKRSRSSNSECTDSSCPNSASILSDADLKDELLSNPTANLQSIDLNEEQLRVLTISEENDRNDNGDKLISENSLKRKTKKFRWRKKRADTPLINQEQKFDWFRTHFSNDHFSGASFPISRNTSSSCDENRNNEEPNNSSWNKNSHLILNSRGVFLKPLITRFSNKASQNISERGT